MLERRCQLPDGREDDHAWHFPLLHQPIMWRVRVAAHQVSGFYLLVEQHARPPAHLTESEVSALQVLGKHAKGSLEHLLNGEAILLARAGGQREARDVTRRTDARRLDILG